ncbi:MAG: glutathione S-transferase N-terminal domain-containing protein [Rhodobacteraceae bacterium]|nr:glutathione S-transferase N-terminal domain-containing protein [Paracoccaceae bacterium]
MRRLYEIGGAEDSFRPSPYCWRTRMALAHKGLSFEAVPWRAVEKARITRSGGGTVPVLVEGDLWLGESWDISEYLEATYPESPFFDGPGDKAKARFLDHWITLTVHPVIFRAVALDQFPMLAREDQAYYLERTKRKFGQSLAEFCGDPDAAIAELKPLLQPLQSTLAEVDYLGGASPGYGDYIVFGALQWARVASPRRLYSADSALARWFENLLGAFDGFARAQPARAHWGNPAPK